MVIYADVLIITNLVVNYFILLACCRLCRTELPFLRLLAGAGVGALFALYIFMPEPPVAIRLLLRPSLAAAIVLTAFGRRPKRVFLRLWAVFLAATLLFGGIMLALQNTLEPYGLLVEGGIVYFDISPLVLVGSTALCYCLIRVIQRLGGLKSPAAKLVSITLALGGLRAEVTALVDTGHSLTDPFSGGDVVLISAAVAEKLLPNGLETAKITGRFRLIPCRTAGGSGLLEGFKVDRIWIGSAPAGERITVAIGENIGGDDYEAIIGPGLLP